jgi:thiol-disulfide isomerase/thioredoxin
MRNLFVLLTLLICVSTFASPAVAQSQPSKLEGIIVCCEDCWAREDRTKVKFGTIADLQKAAGCVKGGDPTLLAVTINNATTLYQLEDGKFKRPGKNWLDFIGKTVSITGPVRTKKDVHFIRVDELTVVADAPAASEQQPNVIGVEAELVMKDLFGTEQKLSSFRGRIVVLNFWATYCLPCRKEMPDLSAIQNQYAALGVQVIGASSDALEDQKKVLAFIKEVGINFPVWLGAVTEDMAKFGLGPGLPATAIIGRDGKIVWINRSVVTEAELKKELDRLLALARKDSKEKLAAVKVAKGDVSSVPS